MKKLIQTRLHNPPISTGNCFPTVIACLMDLESPEDVIQIQALYDTGEKSIQWDLILDMWLERHGWEWFPIDGHDEAEKDEFYLVSGHTSRSDVVTHVCIYQNGKLFHDPHPDQTGLINERSFQIIQKKHG